MTSHHRVRALRGVRARFFPNFLYSFFLRKRLGKNSALVPLKCPVDVAGLEVGGDYGTSNNDRRVLSLYNTIVDRKYRVGVESAATGFYVRLRAFRRDSRGRNILSCYLGGVEINRRVLSLYNTIVDRKYRVGAESAATGFYVRLKGSTGTRVRAKIEGGA